MLPNQSLSRRSHWGVSLALLKIEKKCLQLAQGFSDLFSATESAVVSLLRYKVKKAEEDEKEGQVVSS